MGGVARDQEKQWRHGRWLGLWYAIFFFVSFFFVFFLFFIARVFVSIPEESLGAGKGPSSISMPSKLAIRDIYVASGVSMKKMPYVATAAAWAGIKQVAL